MDNFCVQVGKEYIGARSNELSRWVSGRRVRPRSLTAVWVPRLLEGFISDGPPNNEDHSSVWRCIGVIQVLLPRRFVRDSDVLGHSLPPGDHITETHMRQLIAIRTILVRHHWMSREVIVDVVFGAFLQVDRNS